MIALPMVKNLENINILKKQFDNTATNTFKTLFQIFAKIYEF